MFLTPMHVPSLIEKKRNGGELSADEISYIIANFTRGEIPDYQVRTGNGDLLSRHD